MIVEKKKDNYLMLYTSKLLYRNTKERAVAIKNYIQKNKVEYHGAYHIENTPSNIRTCGDLVDRWDLYPFIDQMSTDLINAQHYLYDVPRVCCHWIPQKGSYNFDRRIKEWEKSFGLDTEVVYDTYIDDVCDIYNGLEAYGGEYNVCYEHDEWISIYHIDNNYNCQFYGGLSLWINKLDYEIKIFGIGEDDGFVFPETTYYKHYIALNKHERIKLCQLLNDIHIDNFDNQKVIDKIWNYPITNKSCYDN